MAVPTTGDIVGGRFVLGRPVGTGGVGKVYESYDQHTTRTVAVKLLHVPPEKHDAGERIRREAMVLMDVQHPAIVTIYEVGAHDDGTLFFAMELLAGETIKERLQRTGPVSLAEVVPVVRALGSALDSVHHTGVVHRDIKPDNLLLLDPATRGPTTPPVKLIDFGIAKVLWDGPMTAPGTALGTPRYMAPEQLRGDVTIDGRADEYALAIVAYEMLSGIGPYPKSLDLYGAILAGKTMPLRQVMRDAPEAIEAVLARAMSLDPQQRYATVGAFAKAFADASPVVAAV